MSASALGLVQLSECTVCLDEKPLEDSVAIHNHALIEHQHRVCRLCLPQLQQLKCPTCRSELDQSFLIQQGADHPAFAVVQHPHRPADDFLTFFLLLLSNGLTCECGSYLGYLFIAQKTFIPAFVYMTIGFSILALAINCYTGKENLVDGLNRLISGFLLGFGIGVSFAFIQMVTISFLDSFFRYNANLQSKMEFAKNYLARLCTELDLPIASEIKVIGNQFIAKWPTDLISFEKLSSAFPNAPSILSTVKINNFSFFNLVNFPVFKLAHTLTFNFEGWVAPAFESLRVYDLSFGAIIAGAQAGALKTFFIDLRFFR